jgi:hypothetical protein
MTAPDPDVDLLRARYRDPVELDRRPEGIRYSATLHDHDGTPVVVLAIARDLRARIPFPERFTAALERAASIPSDALSLPLAWGHDSNGLLHCAYARLPLEELIPGSLSTADVANVGVQLARTLVTAHAAGMTHGAITTARISRTRDDDVQLNAFGLFAALTAGGMSVADAATVLSDAPYVSPEVQMGAAPDERSDVFSLGASLFELLTGKPPFGGRTTSSVMAAVLSGGNTDDASDADRERRSGPVIEALLRAIEQAPDDRWPSATAFANALASGTAEGRSNRAQMARARGCFPIAGAVVLGIATLAGVIGALVR